ncbi:MAG TPA: hypothetical protein VEL79_01270 [Vicinamibacterales bacterium]|nr:hypothetical protein [Vicinamibacterales bacterium]
MKRAVIFLSSLAMILACAKTPEAHNATTPNQLPASPSAGGAAVKPASISGEAAAPSSDPATPGAADPAVRYRVVTLPAGTVLPVDLETSVGSDISRAEQPVRGHLRRAIVHGGVEALPAGTAILGHVTTARRPGRVQGRGYVAMRFTQLDTPGEGTTRISTATIGRMAPATKGKDAIEILAPAAGAAVVGRLVGGKKGAREGALIGGAAGTGYVLSTRGKEVRLGRGANLAVRLTAPVTVRVRER